MSKRYESKLEMKETCKQTNGSHNAVRIGIANTLGFIFIL